MIYFSVFFNTIDNIELVIIHNLRKLKILIKQSMILYLLYF